jgi:hypothetical protein
MDFSINDLTDEEYEELRKAYSSLQGALTFESESALQQLFPGITYQKYEVPRYGNISIDNYGMGYKSGTPTEEQDRALFNRFINTPEFRNLEKKQEELWNQGQALASQSDFYGTANYEKYNELMKQRSGYGGQQRALAAQFNQLYSGRPMEGWDENLFYASNLNFPERKNLQILKEQADSGNENSQIFLNDYIENKTEVVNNEVAQALPAGPSGMDRAPGTYHQNNIIPLQTPGSTWRPGEGYSIQDPFQKSPQTGPGLSTGPRGESLVAKSPPIPQGPYTPVKNFGSKDKPFYGPSTVDTHNNPNKERVIQMRWEAQEKSPAAFDEQKALLASQSADKYRKTAQSADKYRKTAQTQDPFRAQAMG